VTGKQIRRVRQRLHLSQQVFAELLGRNRLTILRWETGQACPTAYEEAMLVRFQQATCNALYVGAAVKHAMGQGDPVHALLVVLAAAYVPHQEVLDLVVSLRVA